MFIGHLQQWCYRLYGRDSWRESMFYSHVLPLPYFLLLSGDLKKHALMWSESPPFPMVDSFVNIPEMWVYLAMNVLTQ